MSRRPPDLLPLLVLGAITALPLLSLLGHPGHALADPLSELPTKLWCFEKMLDMGFFGGPTGEIGFPGVGGLNNPDPVGMVVTALARPLLGAVGAYNLLVWLQLWATAAATYALARIVTPDRAAAVLAGVAMALTPLVLVYCVTGGVTDMLNLWPYPLALRSALLGLHRPGWRDGLAAGAWLGVGFVACPYNLVVFAAMVVPALFWIPFSWRRGPGAVEAGAPPRQIARVLVATGLVGGLIVGGYALRIRAITESEGSHISAEIVAASRHAPPFEFLHPTNRDRYTAFVSDYVAVGDAALLERSAGSRYYRAFSPGWVLLALAAAGVVFARRRRAFALLWLSIFGWCALVSTGPFLPIAEGLAVWTNPAWRLVYEVLGGRLILEPFRYALPAVLALSLAAALGVQALASRYGRWVGVAAVAAWLGELVVVSPVPVPLPTGDFSVSPAWSRVSAALPPGAILALPYFDRGTDRFVRRHFLSQLVHDRPVADEMTGFPPAWLVENQFTASLLEAESLDNRMTVRVRDPARVDADRDALAAAGFAGIVVDPGDYAKPGIVEAVRARLAPLGEPVRIDELWVYPLR